MATFTDWAVALTVSATCLLALFTAAYVVTRRLLAGRDRRRRLWGQ
jgi:hypothetical protein